MYSSMAAPSGGHLHTMRSNEYGSIGLTHAQEKKQKKRNNNDNTIPIQY